ncbi:hypothetical protein QFZ66_005400 [Streptomyces sp. B4I13]|nr:hypothetical protein [Streptomyces sp. B4I13]
MTGTGLAVLEGRDPGSLALRDGRALSRHGGRMPGTGFRGEAFPRGRS